MTAEYDLDAIMAGVQSGELSEDELDQLEADLVEEHAANLRESFYAYCVERAPEFYLEHRWHLKKLCDTLDAFWRGELVNPKTSKPYKKLGIHMPPRHGKTLTLKLFSQWVFGQSLKVPIIVGCYNETLSQEFSKDVREVFQENPGRTAGNRLGYAEIFPRRRIKNGDAAMKLWRLSGAFRTSFLATSPDATATGFGGMICIIDDIVKNAEEAFNTRVLDGHEHWYKNTLAQRKEQGALQILNMTRWSGDDLAGRLYRSEADEWFTLIMPAFDGKEMLCPDILNLETYRELEETMDEMVFSGNYQQAPEDVGDYLYRPFKTYDPAELPRIGPISGVFDTADEGSDFLAGGVVRVFEGKAYMLDVLYTQAHMEVTENQAAAMLDEHRATDTIVESNNGGKGWARNVERKLRSGEVTGRPNQTTAVRWYAQTANKWARIRSRATNVSLCVIMPSDWAKRWPKFYQDVTRTKKDVKPAHDDGPDFLTIIVERVLSSAMVMDDELAAKLASRRKR